VDIFYFYTFSAISLAGALAAVIVRLPVYSILNLALSFFSMAGLFLLLGAEFVAMGQIIVYTGAIVVLFLFVVMIINVSEEDMKLEQIALHQKVFAWVISGAIFVALSATFLRSDVFSKVVLSKSDEIGATNFYQISQLLFKDYLIGLEAIALLLLVAMIGIMVLAKKEKGLDK